MLMLRRAWGEVGTAATKLPIVSSAEDTSLGALGLLPWRLAEGLRSLQCLLRLLQIRRPAFDCFCGLFLVTHVDAAELFLHQIVDLLCNG